MRYLIMRRPFLILTTLFLLAACRAAPADPTPALMIPTAMVSPQDGEPGLTPTAVPPPAVPTLAPTIQPTTEPTIQPTPEPTPRPTTSPTQPPPVVETSYQVAFVTANDTLNVRSGPGVSNNVIGELGPQATGVTITGPGQVVAGSTWTPIEAGGLSGWVNSRYLVESLDSAAFCQNPAVEKVVADLQTAVAHQDNTLLAQLVHPERGLRIHTYWWNPAVRLTGADVASIFTSDIRINWGIQDGSGEPIIGPFSQEILPLLQEDLLPATEIGCDEIIHGGTAGFVRLPDGYDAIHYYSFHRPGTEEFAGMDWGTWVVGIEQWQGRYYVSFLVHFQWEI